MFTIAIASILYYFGIYTFHTEHYLSCLFLEFLLYGCFNNYDELLKFRDTYNQGKPYDKI